MLERLAVTLTLLGLGLLVGRLALRAGLERRARHGLMLPSYRLGRPAILYFTAPGCAPCETVQRPALAAVHEAFGDRLQIFEVDATVQPKLADAWGVLSVPTTFLIDSHGRPRRVNHGPTRMRPLVQQLEAVGEVTVRPLPAAEPALEG
ncbi:MAG TPA: thioredoxin family protein [Anaerolineales bacterium]|nr:thioredoxin family protein [Anaerolineales bacterium]